MEWKKICGFDGLYKVSKCGKVKREKSFVYKKNKIGIKTKYNLSEKKIKPVVASNGYYVFNTSLMGKTKQHYLHRVLAIAFIENPKKLKYINHKDGNKKNNSISNLEWCTAAENHLHAIKLGLKKMPKGKNHCCYGKTRFEIFGN